MYKTTAQIRQEKKTALLWLFVASRGLLADFTGFYKLHHSQTMEDIDREFKELLKDLDNGETENQRRRTETEISNNPTAGETSTPKR